MAGLPNSSRPSAAPLSFGDGKKLTKASNNVLIPTFFKALPNKIGKISQDAMPFFKAAMISSSLNSSPPKNFSNKASSVLATSSFNAPLSSSTLPLRSAGLSAWLPSTL